MPLGPEHSDALPRTSPSLNLRPRSLALEHATVQEGKEALGTDCCSQPGCLQARVCANKLCRKARHSSSFCLRLVCPAQLIMSASGPAMILIRYALQACEASDNSPNQSMNHDSLLDAATVRSGGIGFGVASDSERLPCLVPRGSADCSPSTLGCAQEVGRVAGPAATFSNNAQKNPPKSPWVGWIRTQRLKALRTCRCKNTWTSNCNDS